MINFGEPFAHGTGVRRAVLIAQQLRAERTRQLSSAPIAVGQHGQPLVVSDGPASEGL